MKKNINEKIVLSLFIIMTLFLLSIDYVNSYNGDLCNETWRPCIYDENATLIECTSTDLSVMFQSVDVEATAGNISGWNTSCITSMNGLFYYAYNIPDITNWDTSNVIDMTSMFTFSDFNQNINNWDVSKVTLMDYMFRYSDFNQPLNNWNTASLQSTIAMFFSNTAFNQSLNDWNMSSVTTIAYMFAHTLYNQSLDNWDVSKVQSMREFMSYNSDFNQNLSKWNISGLINLVWTEPTGTTFFLYNSGSFSMDNYDSLLNGWVNSAVTGSNNRLDVPTMYSINAKNSRDILVNTFGWNIHDNGYYCLENWIQYNTSCNGFNYTTLYNDTNNCSNLELRVPIPVDNGTIVECSEITECGTYTFNNKIVSINIANEDIIASPCLELSMNNSTLSCSNNIIGNYGVLAYIYNMNNSIIENCNFSTFIQGFLIGDNMLQSSGENNIFRNLKFDILSSSALGFDVRTGYTNTLTKTLLKNIVVNNTYDNGAINLYGDGLINFTIDDLTILSSYSGLMTYNIVNLNINNYYFNGGTIFGLYLGNTDDAIVTNSNINNVAYLPMLLEETQNAYFNNVTNEINKINTDGQYFASSNSYFNSNSEYNLGWFPTNNNVITIDNINLLSIYLGENRGYNVITDTLVFNKSIKYFINPECIPEWLRNPMPCIDGVAVINYYDYNDCDKLYEIPIDNSTNEYCELTTINSIDSDSIIFSFTGLDAIFWIILLTLLLSPLYMNDKRYLTLWLFAGIILIIYSIYATEKLLDLFPENTFYVNFVRIIGLCVSGLFIVIGFLKSWETIVNLIFGEKDQYGIRRKK